MRPIDAVELLEVLQNEHDRIMQDPLVDKANKWREAVCFARFVKIIQEAPDVELPQSEERVPVTLNEWIPFSEQKPKYEDEYLVSIDGEVAIAEWSNSHRMFYLDDFFLHIGAPLRVSYWAEKPKSPEEDAE